MNKDGMTTVNPSEEKSEIAQPSGFTKFSREDKKRRTRNILIILASVLAIGLFFLFSYWHPFGQYQSGYVSEAQFGEEWPFTVSEARVLCLGSDMVLETRQGIFGITSHAI